MAKTNTELIRELDREVSIIGTEMRALNQSVNQLNQLQQDDLIRLMDLDKRIAVLTQSVDEIKQRQGELDRRLWWFFTLVVAALFAFIGQLLISNLNHQQKSTTNSDMRQAFIS